jgi:hypothetical protein
MGGRLMPHVALCGLNVIPAWPHRSFEVFELVLIQKEPVEIDDTPDDHAIGLRESDDGYTLRHGRYVHRSVLSSDEQVPPLDVLLIETHTTDLASRF